MVFEVPDLPYEFDALEPYIDAKTMEIHHDKHHAGYVKKLNDAIQKHPEFFKKSIGGILKNLDKVPEDIRQAVRNNGGGHANHSWFWEILTPDKSKKKFEGKIAEAVNKKFGSLGEFKMKFKEVALGRFGSGWAWLVFNDGELEILSTANQDNPISEGKTPLFGLDVWEHAYYLRYQNKRDEYVDAFFNVLNWEKVNEIYEKSLS